MLKFRQGYYADARIEDRFETQIMLRNGILEECKSSRVKRAFLRVYDGEMWYYASTSDTEDLQRELDGLYAAARPSEDIADDPAVRAFEVNKDVCLRFSECSVADVPLEEKTALVRAAAESVRGDEVKMTMARYIDRHSDYEFYSSKGAELKYDFQTCGVSVSFALAEGENNLRNAYQRADVRFDALRGIVRAEEIGAFVEENIFFMKNAKPVEAGEYPVILAPMVAGVFAHESFGHKSEADFMIGDETMKREWALGSKVGSDILSIYDSGLDLGSGYVPYDDEGTRAGKTYLIKNGVLAGRLHSVETAAELGERPTGNARAVSCDFEPIVRMTTTVIDAGDLSEEALFAGVKHGYFIKDLKHGSGMSTFTIAPTLCYEITEGRLGDPVRIAVVTGNVFETLSLVDGLSDKKEIFSFVTGGCGKMEQYPLNVGFGGPYVRISKMRVQ